MGWTKKNTANSNLTIYTHSSGRYVVEELGAEGGDPANLWQIWDESADEKVGNYYKSFEPAKKAAQKLVAPVAKKAAKKAAKPKKRRPVKGRPKKSLWQRFFG